MTSVFGYTSFPGFGPLLTSQIPPFTIEQRSPEHSNHLGELVFALVNGKTIDNNQLFQYKVQILLDKYNFHDEDSACRGIYEDTFNYLVLLQSSSHGQASALYYFLMQLGLLLQMHGQEQIFEKLAQMYISQGWKVTADVTTALPLPIQLAALQFHSHLLEADDCASFQLYIPPGLNRSTKMLEVWLRQASTEDKTALDQFIADVFPNMQNRNYVDSGSNYTQMERAEIERLYRDNNASICRLGFALLLMEYRAQPSDDILSILIKGYGRFEHKALQSTLHALLTDHPYENEIKYILECKSQKPTEESIDALSKLLRQKSCPSLLYLESFYLIFNYLLKQNRSLDAKSLFLQAATRFPELWHHQVFYKLVSQPLPEHALLDLYTHPVESLDGQKEPAQSYNMLKGFFRVALQYNMFNSALAKLEKMIELCEGHLEREQDCILRLHRMIQELARLRDIQDVRIFSLLTPQAIALIKKANDAIYADIVSLVAQVLEVNEGETQREIFVKLIENGFNRLDYTVLCRVLQFVNLNKDALENLLNRTRENLKNKRVPATELLGVHQLLFSQLTQTDTIRVIKADIESILHLLEQCIKPNSPQKPIKEWVDKFTLASEITINELHQEYLTRLLNVCVAISDSDSETCLSLLKLLKAAKEKIPEYSSTVESIIDRFENLGRPQLALQALLCLSSEPVKAHANRSIALFTQWMDTPGWTLTRELRSYALAVLPHLDAIHHATLFGAIVEHSDKQEMQVCVDYFLGGFIRNKEQNFTCSSILPLFNHLHSLQNCLLALSYFNKIQSSLEQDAIQPLLKSLLITAVNCTTTKNFKRESIGLLQSIESLSPNRRMQAKMLLMEVLAKSQETDKIHLAVNLFGQLLQEYKAISLGDNLLKKWLIPLLQKQKQGQYPDVLLNVIRLVLTKKPSIKFIEELANTLLTSKDEPTQEVHLKLISYWMERLANTYEESEVDRLAAHLRLFFEYNTSRKAPANKYFVDEIKLVLTDEALAILTNRFPHAFKNCFSSIWTSKITFELNKLPHIQTEKEKSNMLQMQYGYYNAIKRHLPVLVCDPTFYTAISQIALWPLLAYGNSKALHQRFIDIFKVFEETQPHSELAFATNYLHQLAEFFAKYSANFQGRHKALNLAYSNVAFFFEQLDRYPIRVRLVWATQLLKEMQQIPGNKEISFCVQENMRIRDLLPKDYISIVLHDTLIPFTNVKKKFINEAKTYTFPVPLPAHVDRNEIKKMIRRWDSIKNENNAEKVCQTATEMIRKIFLNRPDLHNKMDMQVVPNFAREIISTINNLPSSDHKKVAQQAIIKHGFDWFANMPYLRENYSKGETGDFHFVELLTLFGELDDIVEKSIANKNLVLSFEDTCKNIAKSTVFWVNFLTGLKNIPLETVKALFTQKMVAKQFIKLVTLYQMCKETGDSGSRKEKLINTISSITKKIQYLACDKNKRNILVDELTVQSLFIVLMFSQTIESPHAQIVQQCYQQLICIQHTFIPSFQRI